MKGFLQYPLATKEDRVDDAFLKKLEGVHLLIAGEVGIDEYLWGNTRRISPEAPVPVVEVDYQTYKLGLAANVAQNIVSLGAKATLIGVRGEDADGDKLEKMILDAGIRSPILISDSTRPTLRKVRVVAQKQHVVRVDYEKSHPLDAKTSKRLRESVYDQMDICDAIIVQDYGKGIWNQDSISFIKEARQKKKPVFVDPSSVSSLSLYRGATLLSPNIFEAQALCGQTNWPAKLLATDNKRLEALGVRILEETLAEHVVITCGEWGMVSVSKETPALKRIPTFARDVFDVTGAGDTVIALLALMNVIGQSLSMCMQVANAAAGIVVGRIGTTSVTRDELREELERLEMVGLINS